jgi:hypothetical protein
MTNDLCFKLRQQKTVLKHISWIIFMKNSSDLENYNKTKIFFTIILTSSVFLDGTALAGLAWERESLLKFYSNCPKAAPALDVTKFLIVIDMILVKLCFATQVGLKCSTNPPLEPCHYDLSVRYGNCPEMLGLWNCPSDGVYGIVGWCVGFEIDQVY